MHDLKVNTSFYSKQYTVNTIVKIYFSISLFLILRFFLISLEHTYYLIIDC